MAIIPVPARFGFSDLPKFTLARASNQVRGKYSGIRQALVFPYAIWQLEGTLVELDGIEAGRLRSFLVQLDGIQNKFRLPVPGFTKPLTGYPGTGSEKCDAAAVRSQSLTVVNGFASVPFLAEGDFFSVNDELKMATASVAMNASGVAVVSFKPALRKPVASNTPIVFNNPTILMHSPDDDAASWSIRPPYRQGGKFAAIEAIEL